MKNNFFHSSNKTQIVQNGTNLSVAPDTFHENTFNEQYFFTKDCCQKICDSLFQYFQYDKSIIEQKLCLICAPTLALYMNKNHNINPTLLDIDTRFNFLPNFKYFNLKQPQQQDMNFEIIFVDPPFFGVTIEQICDAIAVVAKQNYETILFCSFTRIYQKEFLHGFSKFNLKPSQFPLEFATIPQSKWGNIVLYGNKNLPYMNIKSLGKKTKKNKSKNQKLKNALKKQLIFDIMFKIYWELFDFDFRFDNFFIGLFLSTIAIILFYYVIKDLKKRDQKFSLDTVHFYCILVSVDQKVGHYTY